MRKFLMAACLVFAAFWPSTAGAACPASFYTNLLRDLNGAGRHVSACTRAARGNNIEKMCNACRPAFKAYARLERAARRNPSCFNADRSGRRLLADMRANRANVRFFARGCGY